MKAAVIHKFGDTPQYEDFADPLPDKGDVVIEVKAVVLENFDKLTASGKHYASAHMFPQFPAIVGHSGVGTLEDGTLVAFGGTKPPYGTMAERAVVPEMYKAYLAPIPADVDAGVASALPAAALTSLLPMKWGIKLQAGETILINGATGVSGKIAVQIAKLLGAGKIVGTGRSEAALRLVMQLGADAVIDTTISDEEVKEAFVKEAGKGYDVVLDFLWGRPTELLFQTLVPKEAGFATHKTRFVEIGQSAGATISLAAEVLRTSGLQMNGAGDIPPEAVPEALKQIWAWIGEGKLSIDIEKIALNNIADAWERKTDGKRIVIVP